MRNFELPGRSLAVGRRGMAATSHATATLAAIEALRDGGNAIDAAVAACAVQCVVEAGSTGIGGDCFALLSRGGSADVVAYNGSGRTPMAATPEWYERHGVETIDRHSPHAVTIPGAVEAWSRLIKDHGRRPLAARARARDRAGARRVRDFAARRPRHRQAARSPPPRSDREANLPERRRSAERRSRPASAGARADLGRHWPRRSGRFLSGPDRRRHGGLSPQTLAACIRRTISRAPRANT